MDDHRPTYESRPALRPTRLALLEIIDCEEYP
jgi:hypothetical protein